MTRKQQKQIEEMCRGAKSVEVGTEKYIVRDVCDMPNGKIDQIHLESNVAFWLFKGTKFKINK